MLTFNGDLREYPRFKTDFMKQVLQEFASAEAAAYRLRSCLGKMSYEIVKNIDGSTDEIWKKLDQKYGKTSVMADLIMNQIKKFRTVKDEDDKRFIEFIDIVEKRYRDFSRMKVDHELSNATAISIIEKNAAKDNS